MQMPTQAASAVGGKARLIDQLAQILTALHRMIQQRTNPPWQRHMQIKC
jgi:hypothetical protein